MGVVLGLLNVRAFHGLHVESALVRAQRVTDPERPLCFGQFIPCVFRSKRPANPVQFGQAFRCNSASASGPFRPGQWRAVACDDVRGIGECGYVVEGSDADVVLSLRREPPVSVMRCA